MTKAKLLLSYLSLFFLTSTILSADIHPEIRKQKEEENAKERRIEGFYDLQFNTVSNLEFSITNTGKLFYNEALGSGTGIWPRGSLNYYIFGGGIWVGSHKRFYDLDTHGTGEVIVYDEIRRYEAWDTTNPRFDSVTGAQIGWYRKIVEENVRTRRHDPAKGKLVSLSYNTYDAESMMVPGRIEDGLTAQTVPADRYRVFFSIDYNPADGRPYVEESAPVWPIWDCSENPDDVLKYDRYFGKYIHDEGLRNLETYPRGPAMISEEDIFCTYKDTDLSRYRSLGSGAAALRTQGYPLRIQYEQMVYSWGFGDYRDFVFVKYDQINMNETDTLWDMWLAPIFDVDIADARNLREGAQNDVTSFYGMEGRETGEGPDSVKAAHNMAYQYSLGTRGETGRGFGYCGFVFLESPAVIGKYRDSCEFSGEIIEIEHDSVGFVRRDTREIIVDSVLGTTKIVNHYEVAEQLGLRTFRNWGIQEDKRDKEAMYDFISGNVTDGPSSPADMRYMMATGHFHMRPHDTARTVVGLVLAGTGKGGDADGTEEDLAELVRKVEFAQTVYDNNFRAPMPPNRATITEWTPLNNGMMIKWNDVAENTVDLYEKGLDFMGYRIYRARRTNLDTFDVNNIAGSTYYPAGKGPFGWREVMRYEIPTPYRKSLQHGMRFEGTQSRVSQYLGVDSMMILGPAYKRVKQAAPGSNDSIEVDIIDTDALLVFRIPRGVQMYSPSYLAVTNFWNSSSDTSRQWGHLRDAGFYNEGMYRNRITAVIGNVDTTAYGGGGPWAKFLYKKCQEDGIDFSNGRVKFYDPYVSSSFLIDSAMLCTLHLNSAMVKVNPLFYEYKRVPVDPIRLNAQDTVNGDIAKNNGEIWIVRDTTVTDTVWYRDGAGNWQWRLDTFLIHQKIMMDTLYQLGTMEFTHPNIYTIGAMIITDKTMQWTNRPWLRTMEHYNMVMDSIYSYARKSWIREYEGYDFSNSVTIREEVIKPFMKEITDDHTFIDIGDDPQGLNNFPLGQGGRIGHAMGDAYILQSDDIGKTEQLFNNVEYYYKIVSYDEGDFSLPTPVKQNDGFEGLPNLVKTYPSAERGGGRVDFKVISQDTDKLGGLFDFKLFAINEERVSQLFAGDTMEVTFHPGTFVFDASVSKRVRPGTSDTLRSRDIPIGLYYLDIEMRNLTKDNKLMYETRTYLEPVLGSNTNTTAYVDHTVYRVLFDTIAIEPVFPYDTIDVGTPNSRFVYPTVNTAFTTGDWANRNFNYAFRAEPGMYGTLGLSFNAAIKQYGGMYRGDSVDMMNTREAVSTIVTKLPARYRDDGDNYDQSWITTDTIYNRSLRGTVVGMDPANMGILDTMKIAGVIATTSDGRVLSYDGGGMQQYTPIFTRFDNGPGVYIVEFGPGGVETLSLTSLGQKRIYDVPYLTVTVRNEFSYKRPALERNDVDSVDVISSDYLVEMEHMELPVQPDIVTKTINDYPYYRLLTPSPINLPVNGQEAESFKGKFNLYAQGYFNSRGVASLTTVRDRFVSDDDLYEKYANHVHYVGTQGRYYLSAYERGGGTAPVDFVHTINIAGAQFVIAYLARGLRADGSSSTDAAASNYFYYIYLGKDSTGAPMYMLDGYQRDPRHVYDEDFRAGDKIKLITGGGVAGFPLEGAKVKFALSNPQAEPVTDDRLDQIKIVPNPYVVSHQAQSSPYDAKLYFTKLPEKCTIDIYSAAGDLVQTIEHDESISTYTKGVAVWNLQTKNAQRISSQTLVALIKTPDGAVATKEFSIVVGGFRITE